MKTSKREYIKAILAFSSCSIRETDKKQQLYKAVIAEGKKAGVNRKQREKDAKRLFNLGYKIWQHKTGKQFMLLDK